MSYDKKSPLEDYDSYLSDTKKEGKKVVEDFISNSLQDPHKNLKKAIKFSIIDKVCGGNQEFINMGLSPNSMLIWKKCFRSPLVSDVSYENLESLGDVVIYDQLMERAIRLFPNITPEELSSIKTHYATNLLQAEFIKKIKDHDGGYLYTYLDVGKDLIHVKDRLCDPILSDLYEAIFGALKIIYSNEVSGLGNLMTLKWFDYLSTIGLYEINRNVGEPSKNITQIFDRLKLYGGINIAKYEENRIKIKDTNLIGGRWVLEKNTVSALKQLNKQLENYLKLDLNSLNQVIMSDNFKQEFYGKSTNMQKTFIYTQDSKETKRKAAEIALLYLSELGITKDWSIKVKKLLIESEIDEKTIKKFNIVLKQNNYVDYETIKENKYSKIGDFSFYQLYAIKANGDRKLLLTIKMKGGAADLTKEIIEKYLISIE